MTVRTVPRDVWIAAALAVLVAIFAAEPAKLIFVLIYILVCGYVLWCTFRK